MPIKKLIYIFISFVVAICLSILPLPDWANWLHPGWVVIVLCYWILYQSELINLWSAWFIGLLVDALYGSILGEHALALTVVAYMTLRAQRLLQHYPAWVQSLFIVLNLFVYNSILFIIEWSLGYANYDWEFWISPLLAILVWPLVCEVFDRTQFKFKIKN